MFCFVSILLLFLISTHAQPQYTPSGSFCTTGDNTTNWNSFQGGHGGFTFVLNDPGTCVNGTTLLYPWHTHVSGLLVSIILDADAVVIPNLSCRLWIPDDPSNANRVDYSNTLLTHTEYWKSLTPAFQWGVHIPIGYRCDFTCTDPNTLDFIGRFEFQHSLYSDGYQSICHPSNVNVTTMKCIRPITNQVTAPYCAPNTCLAGIHPFGYLTCLNGTVLPVSDHTYEATFKSAETCSAYTQVPSTQVDWIQIAPPSSNGLWFDTPYTNYNPNAQRITCDQPNTPPYILQNKLDTGYTHLIHTSPTSISCPALYYGPTCLPCQPCPGFYERCNDTLTGDGKCYRHNICLDRTTTYGLTYSYNPASSTGYCQPNQPSYMFKVYIYDVTKSTQWSYIGTANPDTIPSFAIQYDVFTYNQVIKMNLLIDASDSPATTFCSGRTGARVYGEFAMYSYFRSSGDSDAFGNVLPGALKLLVNTTLPGSLLPYTRCECPAGYWGNKCENVCTGADYVGKGTVCNGVTGVLECNMNAYRLSNGTCISQGCAFGAWGPTCSTPCPRCDLHPFLNRCEQDLTSLYAGTCVCPTPGERIDRTNTTCTPYHCGDPALGPVCGGSTRGICTPAIDSRYETCMCNYGYTGKYCEVTNTYNNTINGIQYEQIQCDCGVQWQDPYPLSSLSPSINLKAIGLIGEDFKRDHFVSKSACCLDTNRDTNAWARHVPILWNQPVYDIKAAMFLCYNYRPCTKILVTSFNSTAYFYTPVMEYTLSEPSNSSTWTLNLSNIWINTMGTPITSASQVNVYEIHRTTGYDCTTTEVTDVVQYMRDHLDEIIQDPLLCDDSHRNANGACCWQGGGDNFTTLTTCSPPYQEPLFPKFNTVTDPFAQWVQRHYDTKGHRKRYPPNTACDLLPTPFQEQDQCLSFKDGCNRPGIDGLVCSGRGRCRPTADTTAFPHPYQCICQKFDSSNYYTNDPLDDVTTAGLRRYLGYSCELDLNPCIQNINASVVFQSICNGETARCIGTSYPPESTLASPGSLTPHCDCNLVDPSRSLIRISANTGSYCEASRCGAGNIGCNINSTQARCIQTTSGVSVCECSLAPENGKLWVGPTCQVDATSCLSLRGDDSGQLLSCGGPAFGTCIAPGTISYPNGYPNLNFTYPWCDCKSHNYTGIHCTTPVCSSSVVLPYHGYCQGALSDQPHCFNMWNGAGVNIAPCNVSRCSLLGGGIPTDSAHGIEPQDICDCQDPSREARNNTIRPQFANDVVPLSNTVGLCYPKCPTYPETDPTAYCGGHGKCQDPMINSVTSSAICLCDYGYVPTAYYHNGWKKQQYYCKPYCNSINSTGEMKKADGTIISQAEWTSYAENPSANSAQAPTCTCITSTGYYNNKEKVCSEYRCFNGGVWIPNCSGTDLHCCDCQASNTLINRNTKISNCLNNTCQGTLPGGITRGEYNVNNHKCACFDPFTWNDPKQQQECDSDICHPHGVIVNTSTTSLIPNIALTGVGLCKCSAPYKTFAENCLDSTHYCNNYCSDSNCAHGGTPYLNSRNQSVCTCLPPYLPPYCTSSTCDTLLASGIPQYGTPNITLGACTCQFFWSDNPKLQYYPGNCAQDPCSRPCSSLSSTGDICGGVFNATTLRCDCKGGWTGTNCVNIDPLKATANCTGHGTPAGPTQCLCNNLWYGPNCTTLRCIANGSTTVLDSLSGDELCVCPDGYAGALCDVVTTPTSSSSSATDLPLILGVTGISVSAVIAGAALVHYYYPHFFIGTFHWASDWVYKVF